MEHQQSSHCPVCGADLPENAAQGLCPACLLKEAAGGGETQFTTHRPLGGAPAMPSLEELGAQFPQWEILEILGRGGMGAVYKVRQPLLDRTVAIKVLPAELAESAEFAERFAQEARMLARLNHPNIVSIHDFGQAGPFCYVLMEYVDGVNLREAMAAGRFSPKQALSVVRSMCDALEYAHDQGVVHRDIKPENILLDASGKVKLVDFGIGKLASALNPAAPYLTVTGDALGTPHYMAPEQVERARDVDHRADIYSLGVVFYELLTGELPLGRFAAPSERAPMNPGVDPVVMKALERQRENRHQNAAQMRTEVERVESGSAPKSVIPSPKAGKHRPWLTWGWGMKIAALLIFIAMVILAQRGKEATVKIYSQQNAKSARGVVIRAELRQIAQSIQDRYELPEGDYWGDEWYTSLIRAKESSKTFVGPDHTPMPLDEALVANRKAYDTSSQLLSLIPASAQLKGDAWNAFIGKMDQTRRLFGSGSMLSEYYRFFSDEKLVFNGDVDVRLASLKTELVNQIAASKFQVDTQQAEVDGRAFRKGQKERLSKLLDEKKQVQSEFDDLQQRRSTVETPFIVAQAGAVLSTLLTGGGCLFGWLALAQMRRGHLGEGRGLGMTLALMIPLALLGLIISFGVTDLIKHAQWKNLELVKSASRGLMAVVWIVTSVWLIATTHRWISNKEPVMAKLQRGFVITCGVFACGFLAIMLFDQLH